MNQERPPAKLGRYEIRGSIGAGGMGVVYRAFDPKLKRHVAVKLLATAFLSDREFSERFRREALALGRLAHPNVVQLFDAGVHQGRAYYVMELLSGDRLDAFAASRNESRSFRNSFDSKEFLDIFTPLADALVAVHAAGVLHRDIKPSNVILGVPVRGAVLTDFGLAAIEGSPGLTMDGEILGTSRYIAPEQLSGEKATGASDVYGLGLCMYEYLTGRPPFADIPLSQLLPARRIAELAPVGRLLADVPAALAAIVDRATKLSPADRYGSSRELHEALARAVGDLPGQGLQSTRKPARTADSPAMQSTARLRPQALLASCAVVAMVAVAGAWWHGASEPRPLVDSRPIPAAVAPPRFPAQRPVELGSPGSGSACGYAGPQLAFTRGRLLALWISAAGRVLARITADGGHGWKVPLLDGTLTARVNDILALTAFDGRFHMLYAEGSGIPKAAGDARLLSVSTSCEATSWSSPVAVGRVADGGALSMAAGRSREGQARLLAAWQGLEADARPSVTTAWCDLRTGSWTKPMELTCDGLSFDDPTVIVTPEYGMIAGRRRRLLVGDIVVSRSRGIGAPWSPLDSGKLQRTGLDRKQPAGASSGVDCYLAFRERRAIEYLSLFMVVSRDGFRTISRQYPLPDPPKGEHRSVRIAASERRIWAVWEGIRPVPQYWSTSFDGGAHWTSPKPFVEFYCSHPTPSIVAGDSGRAWLTWSDGEARVWVMALD